jgi:hypothetical protein
MTRSGTGWRVESASTEAVADGRVHELDLAAPTADYLEAMGLAVAR